MTTPAPERLTPDPRVALAAWRWPSGRVAGVFYDVALLTGEPKPDAWCAVCEGADPWCGDLPNGGCVCRPGRPYWTCSCKGFTYRDACRHVVEAMRELALEPRREERQAQLDSRLGCRHPLTVDEIEEDWAEQRTRVHRECLGCGLRVENRGDYFDRLEADIRERHRLPSSSPWSAAERSEDPS
jgi:hypothetical protein